MLQTKDSSALHLAIAGGHKEVVETLLNAGASPTDEDAVSIVCRPRPETVDIVIFVHSLPPIRPAGSDEAPPPLSVTGQPPDGVPAVVHVLQFRFHSCSPGCLRSTTLPLSLWGSVGDTVVTGILFVGFSQNVGAKGKCLVCDEFRERITFSSSHFHDVTNSISEVSAVGVQLPDRRVTLRMYLWQYVQVWGNCCALYLLTYYLMTLRVLAEER